MNRRAPVTNVTIEAIDRARRTLARVIEQSADGTKYLPLFQILEEERARLVAQQKRDEVLLSKVKQVLKSTAPSR